MICLASNLWARSVGGGRLYVATNPKTIQNFGPGVAEDARNSYNKAWYPVTILSDFQALGSRKGISIPSVKPAEARAALSKGISNRR